MLDLFEKHIRYGN